METKVNEVKKQKSKLKTIFTWVGLYALLFVCVFSLSLGSVYLFDNYYRYYPVSGTSMQPTINPDVSLGLNKDDMVQDGVWVKVTTNVQTNDIIIIQRPTEDFTIIKRVIATEGDMIAICKDNFQDGSNGYYYTFVVRAGNNYVQKLEEAYLDPEDRAIWTRNHSYKTNSLDVHVQYENSFYNKYLANPVDETRLHTYTYCDRQIIFYELREDEIFYMGDHRSNSSDARTAGLAYARKRSQVNPETQAYVVGKVFDIIEDAKTLDDKNMLWWAKLKSITSYFWGNIVDFFAW